MARNRPVMAAISTAVLRRLNMAGCASWVDYERGLDGDRSARFRRDRARARPTAPGGVFREGHAWAVLARSQPLATGAGDARDAAELRARPVVRAGSRPLSRSPQPIRGGPRRVRRRAAGTRQ